MFTAFVECADEVASDGGCFDDSLAVRGDEDGGFAERVDFFELWRGAVRGGMAGVEDEVVVDFEGFEEPEDALGLGVLRGC